MSRSQISTAYFIGTLTGTAALPTVGRWIDRSGGHKVMALISSAFRQRGPIVELHVHLEGSMRPDTIRELADANGVEVPAALSAGRRSFQDFDDFMVQYGVCVPLPAAAGGLLPGRRRVHRRRCGCRDSLPRGHVHARRPWPASGELGVAA